MNPHALIGHRILSPAPGQRVVLFAAGNGHAGPPAPPAPSSGAFGRLGAVYGAAVERLAELEAVLADASLTVGEKLEKLDRLAPIPPDCTSSTLSEVLGCDDGTVRRTNWWRRRMAARQTE